MIQLRAYQQQAEHDIREAYRRGCRAPVLVMPTGSGKTHLFVDIARRASERGTKTLVLVHRQELLNQTSRAMDAFGVEHGLIARGISHSLGLVNVQVASVQTLARRLGLFSWKPDLIVVDEAHHAVGGNTWGKILHHFHESRILGCTATPERYDGKGLGVGSGGFFDSMVVGPSVAELVSAGYLSRPVVYAPSAPVDLSRVHTRAGDYAANELDALMDAPSITGDAVAHYRRLCPGEPSIAFCTSVAHAEHVAEQFRQAGYQAASIDGNMDDKDRRDRIRDLGEGRLNVLTSCEIISEGTDIPVVSAAIMLRPTKSLGLALQQMGRALRVHPGKTRAVILDHAALTLTHGLPDEDRAWSLSGKSKRESKEKESVTQVRQCEQCWAVHRPAPKCPSCGYVYPTKEREVEQRDGELREVSHEDVRRVRAREIAHSDSLHDLIELGKRFGYRNPYAWANHVLDGRRRKREAA